MSLKAKDKVILRLRGPWHEWPWLTTDHYSTPPSFNMSQDEGWLVHDAGDGAVMLESLAVPKAKKERWLCGKPNDPDYPVVLAKRDPKNDSALRWRVHPAQLGMFMLECLCQEKGPKWLSKGPESARLTERPQERSVTHELIALPLSQGDAIHEAEQDNDYSHLSAYAVDANGRPTDIAPPTKPKPPRGTLTPHTPGERANGNAVALELIAALQPSFDDGDGGAENSDYDRDDPNRIGWPHNVISLNTVATATGIVKLHSSRAKHEPPKGELARCRKLAAEVVTQLNGLLPFGGDSPQPFRPFYLVIGANAKAPKKLTGEVIRTAFRGTIYPDTPIDLKEIANPDFLADRDNDRRWAKFVKWAQSQKSLQQLSYVCIGYDTCQEPNLCAVFPRLILGVTKAGSLVGACGTIVQA
jgi:hypothetical protein